MTTTKFMRNLVASTAVVMAFSPLANAGLADDGSAKALLLGSISQELIKATGENSAGIRAGGFAKALIETIAVPSDKTRIVDYPKPATVEHLRITAVVPPKGLEAFPIPVCAEQNNKVVGIWNISAKGEVTVAPWSGLRQSETPTSAACKQFILAARTDINQRMAATQPEAPTPPAPAATTTATVAALRP